MHAKKLMLVVVLGVASTAATCQPDLVWSSAPKTYENPPGTPLPTTVVHVDGFGINDDVDVLPIGTTTFIATKPLSNVGNAAATGYLVSDTVTRWIFVAAPPNVGWSAPSPSNPAYTMTYTAPGPALPASGTAPAPVPVTPTLPANAGCGLYQEVLTADSGAALTETSETNNAVARFFFIPTGQTVNITDLHAGIDHVDIPPAPAITTAVCNVSSGSGNAFIASAHIQGGNVGALGSVGDVDPLPPPPPGGYTGVVPVTITVTKMGKHKIDDAHPPPIPCTETLKAKVTAITQDGCAMKQETCVLTIDHCR